MLFCNVYKFNIQVVIYVFKHVLRTYYGGSFRTFKDYKNTLLSLRGMVYILEHPWSKRTAPMVSAKGTLLNLCFDLLPLIFLASFLSMIIRIKYTPVLVCSFKIARVI